MVAGARNGITLLVFVPMAMVIARCGASTSIEDAGKTDASQSDADAAVTPDGPTQCGPLDVTQYVPEVMHAPNPPHAAKCTTQQSTDFAACEGGDTAKCTQFNPGQPAEACGACIDTQKTDKTWGVLVFDGSNGWVNVEGCVDDALYQVTQEKISGGSGSCGDLLHASYGCQEAACGTCSGDGLTTCVNVAVGGGCASYDAKVQSTTGACGVLFGDAAPPPVTSCFPNPSLTDVAAQRADFLSRMANYMCGS